MLNAWYGQDNKAFSQFTAAPQAQISGKSRATSVFNPAESVKTSRPDESAILMENLKANKFVPQYTFEEFM